MDTSTSQTVVVADSTTPALDPVNALLGFFTASTVADAIKRHPEIREILLADLGPRLAATLEVNGVTYTVPTAADALATLYMRGKALHKATDMDDDFLEFMAEKGYININPEDAKNGACWLKPNDALVFVTLDEWFGELGINRSRGAKGIWGLKNLGSDESAE